LPTIQIPDHVRAHLLEFYGEKHLFDIVYVADHYYGRFSSLDDFYAHRVREDVGDDAWKTMPAAEIERRIHDHRRSDLVLHLEAPADEVDPAGIWVFLFPEPPP
jgi:hypothetical protein